MALHVASVDQAQDNAACIALSRFAQQFGPYPGSGIPPNQYEAENATLHNVGLDATYGSFTGWGYVTDWNADGQSVDFSIYCTTAGTHTLAFRYAAGSGNARRLIAVNGVNVFPNQSFASTGAWDSYLTNTVSCTLPAGYSTVSVSFQSSLGSTKSLNLDNLVVGGDPPEAIHIAGISRPSPGSFHLTWTTVPGRTYQLQYRTPADHGTWTNSGAPIIATDATASADDTVGATAQRFYRVIEP